MSTDDPGKKPERAVFERAVHDLKNPLAVVRASLEWLEVELEGREDALDAIHDAAMASDRLLTIVDDLDSLARLDETDLRSLARFPVLALASRVANKCSARLARSSIAVEASGTEKLDVAGDQRLLERSLTALVDATARGASNGACIEIKVAKVRASVEISVALRGAVDQGTPGLTLDPLDASGLGVYVAQRVAHAHRGRLTVVPTTMLPRIVVSVPA